MDADGKERSKRAKNVLKVCVVSVFWRYIEGSIVAETQGAGVAWSVKQ